MAGKGDKPRDYNRADVKPHSKEWDANYETIFKKEDSVLKTYEIKIQVPKIVVTINALNGTKARELALEIIQKQLFGCWPRDPDIKLVTVVSKNKLYDPTIYAKNTRRKSKDYLITFNLNNGPNL